MRTSTLYGRPLLAAAALLFPGALLWAQTFTESTSTVIVEVPVQVIRDGEPVRGLTAADFEVYDGRKKQTLVGVEVVDLGTPTAARPVGTSLPTPAARRHFLILFDLAFSDLRGIVRAREAAASMIESLHPTDLVGVATYSGIKGPQLVLGFTSDRRQVETAIATLGNPSLLDMNPDPLRLMLGEMRGVAASTMQQQGSSGRGPDVETKAVGNEEMMEVMESFAQESQRMSNSAQRTAVVNFTNTLTDLARVMGSVIGRKYVVYLSEGFDASLLQGATSDGQRDEMLDNAQGGEVWQTSSEDLFGDTKSLNAVEKMLEELRRADCVVESVDIAGLRAAGDLGNARPASGKDTLFNFAKSTGGELFENFNDLSQAMGQMLARTSVTYVLSFQPDKLEWDGSFHRLKVELKDQPRGTRVVARPGYYAPRPFAQRSPMEKMLDAQTQVVAGDDAGALDVAVLAAPFQMPTERAYVPVLIEVDGKSLLAGKQGSTLPTEVFVYAFDSAGVIRDFLSQNLAFEVAKVRPLLEQTGFKFFGHLELPPGDYSLRVLVRNGTTGASGLRIVPLRVPAFATEAALLPAFVPEPPNRWLLAREQPRGNYKQAPYPFLMAGTPYIPSSRPVMVAGEPTQMALVGYALAEGQVQAQARVLGADGREVGPATIEVLKREAGVKPSRLVANVTPPRLSPGEYRLEVKLSAQGATQTSSTPFVVRGG